MTPLSRRIRDDNITLTAIPAPPDPNRADWPHFNYDVTLHRPGAADMSLETGVQYGTGNTSEPTAHDVMSILTGQAAAYENTDGYREWVDEYGGDPDEEDEPLTPAAYALMGRMVADLQAFLGDDYDDYLFNTDQQN